MIANDKISIPSAKHNNSPIFFLYDNSVRNLFHSKHLNNHSNPVITSISCIVFNELITLLSWTLLATLLINKRVNLESGYRCLLTLTNK